MREVRLEGGPWTRIAGLFRKNNIDKGSARQLYFLHIPKTAGTTLSGFLRNNFEENEIIARTTWNELYDELYRGDKTVVEQHLREKKLLMGHFANGITRHLTQTPDIITVLRDPNARTLSQLSHIKKDPLYNNWVRARFMLPHENIADVVNSPERIDVFKNYQARYVIADFNYIDYVEKSGFYGGDLLFDSSIKLLELNALPEEDLLHAAKKRLDEMKVVGVQDYIDELMIYLSYLYNWRAPQPDSSRKMSATGPEQIAMITDNEEKIIDDITSVDFVLYETYKSNFEALYLSFLNDLLPRRFRVERWDEFMGRREFYNEKARSMLRSPR